MKKWMAFVCCALLLVVFTGCLRGYSSEHLARPIVPPAPPTDFPPPTPRPTPEPTPPPPRIMPAYVLPGTAVGTRTADFNDLTAHEWAANVGKGWNLGNTLDAAGNTPYGFAWLGGGYYATTEVIDLETAWLGGRGAVTTRENIEAVAAAGFNTIRIPVTWFKAMDENQTIREDWMERVQEVVDWAMDAGLKVILNTHHDNPVFRLLDDEMYDSRYYVIRVWQQVAYRFRDYNERLIFNGFNEPRTYGTPNEWTGGTPEERANLNILNQYFVNTVRASGGNNAYRVLLVPTYAASTVTVAMNDFVLPTDTIADRLLVALHIYSPFNFALNTGAGATYYWNPEITAHRTAFTNPLTQAYNRFIAQGIPVILSEMGAMNRDNEYYRAIWAYHFTRFARSVYMPTVWWDNNAHSPSTPGNETFGMLHRATNTWSFPSILDAILLAAEVPLGTPFEW